MIKKLSLIILIISFIITLPSCKIATETKVETSSETILAVETIQERFSETAVVETLNPIQEKLNLIETQYSTELRKKIELISNSKYMQAILNDDRAIEAINFFNSYGYSDLLLNKKIALQEFGFVKLYYILKNYDKETDCFYCSIII